MIVALDFLLTEVPFGWQNWFLPGRSDFLLFSKTELSFWAKILARSVLFPKENNNNNEKSQMQDALSFTCDNLTN